MLEIRNLVKVYKTKGGAEVRALDGVSVKFEEKGMVFLLGKSGSGKSTLLNLCGGLDSPDAGEIIIKGRSSKDFSQSDFDSYRNTFVGFVFQEYNILNEFSVEDNIALALELQGKNKNKEQVHSILAQVDLENFAKRKPNTLSGGQKQRVAIARALVKNPEIIMADEPTGALDSNTGKQVFDTLKKLSREKLVIVVSHDREFAEIYGDRIIELKDGKIISDVTKTKIAAVDASENISFIGNDTISVRSGAKLTESDIQKIQDFLLSSDEDVIISNGQKEISDFKKAARIDENGARESFKDTDETAYIQKRYSADESKFIRSKLPARHALRIGASSLKIKPFRLIFTILLSLISFTLFGLFSTLTFYNELQTAYKTYLSSGYNTLNLNKKYRYTVVNYEYDTEIDRWESYDTTLFTPEDVEKFNQNYEQGALGVYNYSERASNSFAIENVTEVQSSSSYYKVSVTGFAELRSTTYWQDIMLTDTDLSSLGVSDVVISSYLFDSIKNAELLDSAGNKITLNNYGDIVGKQLILNASRQTKIPLTVKGVYNQELPKKYDYLKEGKNDPESQKLSHQLDNEIANGMYLNVLVSEQFYQTHKQEFDSLNDGYVDYGFSWLQNNFYVYAKNDEACEHIISYLSNINQLPQQQGAKAKRLAFFDGRTSDTLLDGETVVPFYALDRAVNNMIEKEHEKQNMETAPLQQQANELQLQANDLQEEAYQLRNEGKTEEANQKEAEAEALTVQISEIWEQLTEINLQYEDFFEKIEKFRSILQQKRYTQTIQDGDNIIYQDVYATEEEITEALQNMLAFFEQYENDTEISGELNVKLVLSDSYREYCSTKIVGFYYAEINMQESGFFFSASDYAKIRKDFGQSRSQQHLTNYQLTDDAIYNSIVIPFPSSENLMKILRQENKYNNDDTCFFIRSEISDQLMTINDTIGILEKVFLWVGIVMAVFAMLLLFNFISVSITNKKKEIGILRAVGARSTDVFKIFYSESAIITAICFVLAMVASFVICDILNRQLAGTLGAAIFVFGPLSWLVLLSIALVTSFIATFLPVYGIAKKKPVESIRAL